MSIRMGISLFVLATVVAAAIGCGGSDDDGGGGSAGAETSPSASSESGANSTGEDQRSSGSTSPAKAQFVKQASAICKKTKFDLNKEGEAFVKQQQKSGKPQQVVFGELARKILLPAVEREGAAIAGLTIPEGDEEQIEEMLAAQQAGVDAVRELSPTAPLGELESPFDEANERFQAYGIPACVM